MAKIESVLWVESSGKSSTATKIISRGPIELIVPLKKSSLLESPYKDIDFTDYIKHMALNFDPSCRLQSCDYATILWTGKIIVSRHEYIAGY